MTKISDLHRRWSVDADYKEAYDAFGEEFDLARALIEARAAAGLSQSQLARRMKTSQSYIARIEGPQAPAAGELDALSLAQLMEHFHVPGVSVAVMVAASSSQNVAGMRAMSGGSPRAVISASRDCLPKREASRASLASQESRSKRATSSHQDHLFFPAPLPEIGAGHRANGYGDGFLSSECDVVYRQTQSGVLHYQDVVLHQRHVVYG